MNHSFDNQLEDNIFKVFFNNSPAPSWIADEDGHALFMNEYARKIYKVDEDYQNKHACELFPKVVADRFLRSNRAVLLSGKPVSLVIESSRIDGSCGVFLLNKVELPSGAGKRIIGGYAIDITDQVNVKKALEQSNERFDIIANAISDCIWDCDLTTGVVYRSAALMTLTGYSAHEIKDSLSWWEQKTHPDDREASITKFRQALQNGDSYCEGEYRFLCANNQYRHFYDKGYILYQEGKPVRAIGIVHDITESKAMEEKLMQDKIKQQQEISQAIIATQDFVSNELSKELHDNVNQLLATVSMMLYSVKRNNQVEEQGLIGQCHEYVQLAMEEIRKISKSLNTSFIKDIGLVNAVKEIVTHLQRNLSLKATFQCSPCIENQLCNEQKLMIFRIVQEQVNNIIKHAQATNICISLSQADGCLTLIVRDNGVGFKEDCVKKGIGLSNIRNRVEAFNGTLEVRSAPHAGCRLEVSIPLEMNNPVIPIHLINNSCQPPRRNIV